MKVIMLSIDQNIFQKGSEVRSRMKDYGTVIDELHVIVYTKPGFISQQLAHNIFVYPTNTRFRPFYFLDVFRVAQNISVNRETIVDSQEAMTSIAGIFLKIMHGARLHVQVHTDFMSPFFRKESFLNFLRFIGYRMGISVADGIRVVSQRIKDSLVFSKKPIHVLPIFVDQSKRSNQDQSIDLHKEHPQFEFIILMVSRLTREKNIMLGLEAVQKVSRAYSKVGLIIVGDGGELTKLQQATKTYGLSERVIFKGWQHDLKSFYTTADCYLLTSNYEGYGRTLVEAGIEGCPIVTTNVGVVGEHIHDKKEGLVCAVGDVDCIADALLQLIENPALRKQLSMNVQQVMRDNSAPKNKKEYLSKYKSSLQSCIS